MGLNRHSLKLFIEEVFTQSSESTVLNPLGDDIYTQPRRRKSFIRAFKKFLTLIKTKISSIINCQLRYLAEKYLLKLKLSKN